jgi:tagatose-6-phosphate ketose/aldose isomerase
LDQDTLFVCFLSGNRRVQEYERNLLEEIGNKQLVRTRVAIAASAVSAIDSPAEHNLAPAGPVAVADDYRAAVDVIFGQLLGLFFSLRCNLRPDCPSPNGAISRVVQNVSIHS